MKIILLQDVAKVGRKYEVKEVNDGFARNFLIGQGRAVVADQANLAKFEGIKKNHQGAIEKTISSAQQLFEQLKDQSLIIKAKANPEGHLFAALHEKEIVAEIKKQFGFDLPTNLIILDKPIKQIGENKIALKTGDRVANLSIVIEAI